MIYKYCVNDDYLCRDEDIVVESFQRRLRSWNGEDNEFDFPLPEFDDYINTLGPPVVFDGKTYSYAEVMFQLDWVKYANMRLAYVNKIDFTDLIATMKSLNVGDKAEFHGALITRVDEDWSDV